MSAVAAKRFTEEFASILDRSVSVSLKSGLKLVGRVMAFNQSDYSLWLADVTSSDGRAVRKLFVAGSEISSIEVLEKGPELDSLYEKLNKTFPNMVRYLKDAGVIVVMDRIRVTKDGVVEGTGTAAQRVQKIWEEWRKEEVERFQSST
ncbi:MAG: Lsm family RNA-binding protein [Thaumarchaeota archaeon]|nr:Lsm family RNA-binding protein [Candidatus Calditenuaceae archaeon]